MKSLSLLFLFALLQAVGPQPAIVQGVVFDVVTSQPLARATVQLRGSPSAPRSTSYVLSRVTGNDGIFDFRNVPPGDYTVEVSHGGYITRSYGERPHTLNPGQSLSGIQIALTPGAVIYGQLFDDRGDVIVGATVEALRTTYRQGRRERIVAQSTTSNDLGEYRLFMLQPGEYRVGVKASNSSRRVSIPWFFPGTLDAAEAQAINLKVGEALGGISFTSIPTRTRKVAGIVLGANGNGVSVVLSSRGGDVQIEASANRDTGEFEFAGVPPGAYTLVARSAGLRASVSLDVGSADVLSARITLGPGHTVPVRVRIEGHGDGPDPALERLYFIARRVPSIPGLEVDAYSPFADGRFIFDLLAGDYRVELTRTMDLNMYIKSMRLGEMDGLNHGLNVSNSSDIPLEIVVGTDPGSVSGRVTGSGATVVLVPDTARRGQDALYQSVRPGATGEFTFVKVPPGDYKLFAWQQENGGPWLDAEYLRLYEERGTPVRVGAGQRSVVEGTVPVF